MTTSNPNNPVEPKAPGAMAEEDPDITPMTIVSTMVRPTGKYSLAEGMMLGSYRIRKPLGRGGMGEVYLALHTRLNVLRAIKVLPYNPAQDQGKYGERFLREARMAIRIEHPNVITVFDAAFDERHKIYYSVMEYVDGGTVRSAIRSLGAYNEKAALMVALKLSEALMAAAQVGMVHRDIKPDNIMLTRNGVVKLADMGIACAGYEDAAALNALSERSRLTGTPAYMAPEQVTDPDSVDARADIYSLGVTLFEMLTATKPYTGANAVEILRSANENPLPDPRSRNKQLSKACAKLVMRMMARNREERPASAAELNQELKALLSGGAFPVNGGEESSTSSPTKKSANPKSTPAVAENAAVTTPPKRWRWFIGGALLGVVFTLPAAMAGALLLPMEWQEAIRSQLLQWLQRLQ